MWDPGGHNTFLAGNIGTTIILTGLFVIDILLLTHWSVSNGAKKVGEQTEKRIGHVKARIREKQEAYHSARNAAENAGEQYNLTDFIFHKPTIKNIKKDDTEYLPVNVFSPADEKGNLYVVKQQTKLFPRMHRFYCLKIILICWKDIKSAKKIQMILK